MPDFVLLLLLLAGGTFVLWLVAMACFIGGDLLSRFFWWFVFGKRQK